MQQAKVLRQLCFEDLGIIAEVLKERDIQFTYHDVGLDDFKHLNAEKDDLWIILGGPISVYDQADYPFLEQLIALTKKRLSAKKPTLGICLGAQVLAMALGAEVKAMGYKEIGFFPLQLTQAGQNSILENFENQNVLHWHGDTFALPSGAALLASSARCTNQAFIVENYALALQFHLEVAFQNFERWLIGHSLELAQASIKPSDLRVAAKAQGATLEKLGQTTIHRWLDLAQMAT